MPPAPATSEMLAEMSACAYRLGMRFGEEAERAEDTKRCLEMYQLFDRCFFAVRVATALQLRLRREGGLAAWREPAGDVDTLTERERLETERPESNESEPDERERLGDRDRDRETERASLPVFLTTLKGVAAEAAALPGPTPAELPTLQDLLAKVTGEPAPARPASGALRDRLAASAAVAVATLPQPPRLPPGLPPRRATGPPRR